LTVKIGPIICDTLETLQGRIQFIHTQLVRYRLSVCTEIGDLELPNGRYFALLHQIW